MGAAIIGTASAGNDGNAFGTVTGAVSIGFLWVKLLPFSVKFFPVSHLLEMRTRPLRIKVLR
jgi:hypothetical protein